MREQIQTIEEDKEWLVHLAIYRIQCVKKLIKKEEISNLL